MPSGIVSTTSSTSSAKSLGAPLTCPGRVTIPAPSVDRQARVDVLDPGEHAAGQVGDVGATAGREQPGCLGGPHTGLAHDHDRYAGWQLSRGRPVPEPVEVQGPG